ncbi:MAG: 3,4-dihydroxy-2-butanone-4-phosphate synthase, partial [Firmicutes bacterium]|nr:3,4-dihydroxy-2-butanone-4-phosphate synthase [Bacillota bacterium]
MNKTAVFCTVDEALSALRQGEMIVVVDDEGRENEGDLIMAAQFANEEAINFMAQWGRGLICAPMSNERANALNIPLMVPANEDSMETAFTVSVDASQNTTTGISAHDRAVTARVLANPNSRPEDLHRPGHLFPLRAKDGGIRVRGGHTEASVDLMIRAGLEPVAVICEIMNPDGSMARLPQLIAFTERFGLKLLPVAALMQYSNRAPADFTEEAQADLPTKYGDFHAIAFTETVSGLTHLALVHGDITSGTDPVLVRIHSECLTGDVFGSLRCDC